MNPIIEDKIKKARIKLFIEPELMYFGILLYKFELNVFDFNNDYIEAYIEFHKDNDTNILNNTINLNEQVLLKSDYTSDNLVATLCHEIIHILERHSIRKKNRQKKYWVIAAEHCTERSLQKIKCVKPYMNSYNLIPEISSSLPNAPAEEIYEWIIKNINNFKITELQNNILKYSDKSSEWYVYEHQYNINTISSEDIKNSIEQFKAQASSIFENLKGQNFKGNQSSNIIEYLQELLKVEIPWYTLLERSIKQNVIRKIEKRKWKSPNKKLLNIVKLPGKSKSNGNKLEYGSLYMCIDTSGSISKNDLEKFYYIISKSFIYFDNIKLFIHDTTIKQEKEFNRKEVSKFIEFINSEGFVGRGGTSHKYVFNAIQKLFNDDIKIKNMLSLVILLTDGDSDIQEIYKSYTWIKNNIPIVILSTKKFNFINDIGNISIIHIS